MPAFAEMTMKGLFRGLLTTVVRDKKKSPTAIHAVGLLVVGLVGKAVHP
jgi:hypothetical protein